MHNHELSFLDVCRLENSVDDVFKNEDGAFMLFLFPFFIYRDLKKLAHDQRTSKTNSTSNVYFTQTMQFSITVETFKQVNVVQICCVLPISSLIYLWQ